MGGERFNFFSGCPNAKTCTIVLRGGAEHVCITRVVRCPLTLAQEAQNLEVAGSSSRFASATICDAAVLAQMAERGPVAGPDGGSHGRCVPGAAMLTEILQHGHITASRGSGSDGRSPAPSQISQG